MDGYELSPKAIRAFNYTLGSVANPGNPAVFKMWKKGTKQSLIEGKGFFGIVPDGRPYTINFATGKKAQSADADGDIVVSISRPLDARRKSKYDWSFSMKAVQGGVLETDDEFMYLAPEAGYATEVGFQFKESDAEWTYRIRKKFFVQTHNGQHIARINVEVFAHYDNEAVFSVDYAVNTNGSRSLE